MMPSSTTLRAYLAVIGTVFFWSTSLVAIRYEVGSFSPGALALMRHISASVVMLFLYSILSKKTRPSCKEALCMMILGVIGFAAYNFFLNLGETQVSAAVAGFMIGQLPIAITLMSILFLKSRIHAYGMVGLGISVLGTMTMLLTSQSGSDTAGMGIVYLLIAIVLGSVFLVLQKPLLKTFHPIEMIAFATWGATLALLVYTPTLWQQIQIAAWPDITIAIYLGVCPSAIAYSLWSFAIAKLPVVRVGSFLYAMPLLTLLLSVVILGEGLSLWGFVGGSVALLGAYLIAKNTTSSEHHNE